MPDTAILKNKICYPLGASCGEKFIAAVSTRQHKNMSLFYGDIKGVLDNRRDFLANLDIDYRDLTCVKQVHASSIKYVKEKDKGRGALSYEDSIAETDALVTDKKNLPLAIFTADCLSIFLLDTKVPAIGIVHAGWRSTRDNIVTKAIQAMQKEFKTATEDLRVGFGPSIRSCCYEVGEEFKGFFPDGAIQRNGRYYLDLAGINKKQIANLGVREANVSDPALCTSCRNEEFFSYRRESASCGRMLSVIMLKMN